MNEHSSDPPPPSPVITTEILELAYRQGVFPMGEPGSGEIHWYQPEPRAIIDLEGFHVSRRLAKTLRSGRFRFTVNAAFREVMERCGRWERPSEVWITDDIVDLYCQMQALGKAHSVEAWEGERLVGGLYGVALGGGFYGRVYVSPGARRLEGLSCFSGGASSTTRFCFARYAVFDRASGAVWPGDDRA